MDQIVGISVLQPIWIPGLYRLWFTGLKASGEKSQGWIFITENGKQGYMLAKVPDFPDGCNSIWRFTRNGNNLDCTPSVNWVSWGFHNAGSWSTEYVEMTRAEKLPPKFDEEDTPPSRWHVGHTVHYDLNLEGGRELIPELKREGILI